MATKDEISKGKILIFLIDLLIVLLICFKLRIQVHLFEEERNLFTYIIALIEDEEARICKEIVTIDKLCLS